MWTLLLAAALAHETEEDHLTVVVESEEERTGDRVLDAEVLRATPLRSTEEILRDLPGLQLSAHGGRGKAWQFLYRGFDAEHGGDLDVRVEGVPVNEPHHVHAHGYADLGFVPTFLVRRARLSPGVDRAEVGAFGVAASIDLDLGLEETGYRLRLTGGTDRSGALAFAWRPEGWEPGTFVVGEVDAGLGVAEGRAWRQTRVGAGVEGDLGEAHGRLVVLAHHADFDSPGVLREDDLLAGRVPFYGRYPEAGGGLSERVLALGRVGRAWEHGELVGEAWADLRRTRLLQDFTGFLLDPERGDAQRQVHDAARGGARLRAMGRWRVADHPWRLEGAVEALGLSLRQGSERVDASGVPWSTELSARVREVEVGSWVEAEAGWAERVRLLAGVRLAGWHQAAVQTLDRDTPLDARRWVAVVAPRVRLEGRPIPEVALFAGWGRGVRPPRATGGVFGATSSSDTFQGGVDARPLDVLRVSATGFHTTQEDELVFDHPSGAFVGAGASRRVGGELLVEARPLQAVRVSATVSFADGRLVATGDPVPYAPRWMGSLSVGTQRLPLPLGTLSTGMRAWVIAPRPLPEGFRSRWSGSADLLASWEVGRWGVGVQVDNVVGTTWRDGEFVFASWWDRDRARSELPALHVTAGTPTAGRLWVEVRL